MIGLPTDCSNSPVSKLSRGAYGASLSASLLNSIDVLDIYIYIHIDIYTHVCSTISLLFVVQKFKKKKKKNERRRRDGRHEEMRQDTTTDVSHLSQERERENIYPTFLS